MHALSVQYYEVVQVYRVELRLNEIERCLFVPMKLIDFNSDALVTRFRLTLAAAALNGDVRQKLSTDPDVVEATVHTGAVTSSAPAGDSRCADLAAELQEVERDITQMQSAFEHAGGKNKVALAVPLQALRDQRTALRGQARALGCSLPGQIPVLAATGLNGIPRPQILWNPNQFAHAQLITGTQPGPLTGATV